MPAHATHQLTTVRPSGRDDRIEAPSDLRQRATPDGAAARADLPRAPASP